MWDPSKVGNTMYSAGLQLAFLGKLKGKNDGDHHAPSSRRSGRRRGISGHASVAHLPPVLAVLLARYYHRPISGDSVRALIDL
ncbi:hypothetical protein ACOMHN_007000 [Nucella lapillus]